MFLKNIEKFKRSITLYFRESRFQTKYQATVLYKLLYFIDFNYYEKYEEQLIGALILKSSVLHQKFINIVKEMEGKDLVKIQDKYFKYLRQNIFH